MTLRTVLGLGAAVASLTLAACSPPPIRCETDDNCLEDQKCDVRQGLCVDEGEYIEDLGGTAGTGTGDSRTGSSAGSCSTVQGS
ncbi:hypothetical protein [Hyalangium minutum]|uniref:Lipoprotein n=1 Tax=Hyalangium minutum TaxID=394096 RepID=A0A085W5J3_9BACT|nr:hypothetical protein [Hyalangium minutum]KFE62956.1 hypothetical protein DB31_3015 [Hyalangium minutum]